MSCISSGLGVELKYIYTRKSVRTMLEKLEKWYQLENGLGLVEWTTTDGPAS